LLEFGLAPAFKGHMRTTRFRGLLAGVFALASGAFLARFELHTDDTGVEVFLLLVCCFVIGLICARRAWVWGLVVSLSIPAGAVWKRLYGTAQGARFRPADSILLTRLSHQHAETGGERPVQDDRRPP
jgi:hypothetical protein